MDASQCSIKQRTRRGGQAASREGANITVADRGGWTPLHSASQSGHVDIVRLFLRLPETIADAQDDCNRTALFAAARWGHPDVVQLLATAQVATNAEDWHGSTPLFAAVRTSLHGLGKHAIEAQVLCRHREAVAELDACIQKIRGIAGYERFLLGQTAAEMQECATGDTIAVVNISGIRSDAILVSPAAVKTLNLPRLSASDAEVWLGKKWTGRRSERPQKNKEYLDYLSWLWEACVKQILDEVCNTHDTANGLPRIWWIGTGLASSMPFHAAGTHSSGSTENAFSRAIASYTPSIKALGHGRHRARATESARGSVQIATMPTTPGNGTNPDSRKPAELPGVIEEKKQVMDVAGGHLPVELLDLPSVEQVVGSLKNCAHFACHGSTDHWDPSDSGLILQRCEGGQAEQDQLTVRRVGAEPVERATGVPVGVLNGGEQGGEAIGRGDPCGERVSGGRLSACGRLPLASQSADATSRPSHPATPRPSSDE